GNENFVKAGSISSPVESRRSIRRSSRYSCPRSSAAVTSAEPPVARPYSRRPSRTSIVVWNDPRLEPFYCSQFQPPSAICSPIRRYVVGLRNGQVAIRLPANRWVPVEQPIDGGHDLPTAERCLDEGATVAEPYDIAPSDPSIWFGARSYRRGRERRRTPW